MSMVYAFQSQGRFLSSDDLLKKKMNIIPLHDKEKRNWICLLVNFGFKVNLLLFHSCDIKISHFDWKPVPSLK